MAGAAAGVLIAVDIAMARVETTGALLEVKDALAAGFTQFEGSLEHLADFVRHLESGDGAFADLDAAIFAVEDSQGDLLRALTFWDTLQDQIE